MKSCILIGLLSLITGTAPLMGQWSYNGINIYNTNAGNVGIGTNSPAYLLHVAKNTTAPCIRIQNLGGSGGAAFEMVDNLSGANWKFKATTTGGFKIRDHANSLDVITIEENSAANSIYIKSGGNVGIGNVPLADTKLYVLQNASAIGIYSLVNSEASTAVEGRATSVTGTTYGLSGYQNADNGAAGIFIADNNDGQAAGVYARTDGGTENAAFAIAGHAYFAGVGMGAWSYTGDLIRGYDGDYPGGTLRFYVTNSGAVYADGGYNTFKKVSVPGGKQEYRTVNAIHSSEAWIEDIGSAQLVNGKATVFIDPVYAEMVNTNASYKVFITPVSEEIVFMVVTAKNPGSFTVKGVSADGRAATCSFDYRIVAIDNEKTGVRMEKISILEPVPVNRPE